MGKKIPTAGCGKLTMKQSSRLCKEMDSVDAFHSNRDLTLFVKGFAAGLAFVVCPEEADMYGSNVIAFIENSYSYYKLDEVAAVLSEITECLDDIEEGC